MLIQINYRELTNGKRYGTSIERIMGDHGSTEENAPGISSENAEGDSSEIQTLPQEAFNEQIRGLIAPLTHQLEELTRLVQGMTTTQHPNHYPRTEFGTTSGTPLLSPTVDQCNSSRGKSNYSNISLRATNVCPRQLELRNRVVARLDSILFFNE